IVYLHNVSRTESLFFPPYYKALKQFKKEGRAKFIGVSTHQNEPEVIRAAADCGELDVVLTAYAYNQDHRDEIGSAIDHAAKAGMGIVGMKQLAGTYRKLGASGRINARAALKWSLQNKNMHTLIPGITTFDQLETDLSVMEDLKLRPGDEADLVEYRKMASLFCQQCRACLDQCPADLDIPTLMRCHMYVHGYGNLAAAREALTAGDLERPACLDCDNCSVSCTAGFDVKAKVLDVARIKDVPKDFVC
ncbi:MAG: oxidoreductase, partial [bacterium]|nr:oxidoreductase [bacterium]